MREHHREQISRGQARPTACLMVTPCCPSHPFPARSLSERHQPSPVALAEAPVGAPSPFAPPRGSWRTPAAAPVKGRSRRAATVSGRRPHHPATAVAATSRRRPITWDHSSMGTSSVRRSSSSKSCITRAAAFAVCASRSTHSSMIDPVSKRASLGGFVPPRGAMTTRPAPGRVSGWDGAPAPGDTKGSSSR